MKIVFVHGREQQGKDPQILEGQWRSTLAAGLKKAALTLPSNATFAFPYYGDLLDELVKKLDTPLSSDIAAKGAAIGDKELEFRQRMFMEIASQVGVSDSDIAAHYSGPAKKKGALNWGWVQAILRSLDKTSIGPDFIDIFTRDVYAYLVYDVIRAQINAVVQKEITSESCVVVAHSLGSIVSYVILQSIQSSANIKAFITVGCPLGINAIKDLLPSGMEDLHCTSIWYNARDQRDVVALYPLDKNHFDVKPQITNNNGVNNQTSNRHGIVGYLNDANVAKAIQSAIF